MSLRYVWRIVYQTGMRGWQGMKDQGSKCGDSAIKSLRDSASSSSSKQVRRFSNAFDSPAVKASNSDKLKQAEESLRTIMYLSCWGPN
ncbi:uncharacterized protein LOC114760257 [Neltuma alba]|uniref:uncharacterized protein LOC114760257 n=1 Tax=Neltuma alba TaxID=207710 RepID=UPI0010A59934|nr:uncharacterized protein LOC114760257 [Prosopis alba]